MKKLKLLLSFVVTVLFIGSISAQDQKMWVGIDLSYNSTKLGKGDAVNSFIIGPTFGYHVNDMIAVGLRVLYQSPAKDVSGFGVAPFVRYSKSVGDKATLYGELAVEYQNATDKTGATEEKISSFGAGISPGVTYRFADRWGLQATFGRLGFTSTSYELGGVKEDDKLNNFGLNLTMSSLSFALTYHF